MTVRASRRYGYGRTPRRRTRLIEQSAPPSGARRELRGEPARAHGSQGVAGLDDVIAGLAVRPRSIACKYLYDERGSELFDRICGLEVYYPTRTEIAILRAHGREIAAAASRTSTLVELGSGLSHKTRLLLRSAGGLARYVPVDICEEALEQARISLSREFPALTITPVCADYTRSVEIDRVLRYTRGPAAVAFFGSTIGNFHPDEAAALLCELGRVAQSGGGLVIGVDLRKESRVIEAAYNDPQGVTAAFNLNVLVRLNRELGADFDVDAYRHRAIFDETRGRIEMQLVSMCRQRVHIGGISLELDEGEPITTEHSYKYSLEAFAELAESAGFEVERVWTDPDRYFGVHLLIPTELPRVTRSIGEAAAPHLASFAPPGTGPGPR